MDNPLHGVIHAFFVHEQTKLGGYMNLFRRFIAFIKRLLGIRDRIHHFSTDEEYERDKRFYPSMMNAPDQERESRSMEILIHKTGCGQLTKPVPGRRADETQNKVGGLDLHELLAYGRNTYPANRVRFARCCLPDLQEE